MVDDPPSIPHSDLFNRDHQQLNPLMCPNMQERSNSDSHHGNFDNSWVGSERSSPLNARYQSLVILNPVLSSHPELVGGYKTRPKNMLTN